MNAVGRRAPWAREGAPVVLASIFSFAFLLLPILPILTACNEEATYLGRFRSKRRFMSGSAMRGSGRSKPYSEQEYKDCLARQPYRWTVYAIYVILWMLVCSLAFLAYTTMRAGPQSRATRIIVGSLLPLSIVCATGLAIGLTVESFD
ncbi:unnamed protein product, partial [Mesorhabditis spiculigera]